MYIASKSAVEHNIDRCMPQEYVFSSTDIPSDWHRIEHNGISMMVPPEVSKLNGKDEYAKTFEAFYGDGLAFDMTTAVGIGSKNGVEEEFQQLDLDRLYNSSRFTEKNGMETIHTVKDALKTSSQLTWDKFPMNSFRDSLLFFLLAQCKSKLQEVTDVWYTAETTDGTDLFIMKILTTTSYVDGEGWVIELNTADGKKSTELIVVTRRSSDMERIASSIQVK